MKIGLMIIGVILFVIMGLVVFWKLSYSPFHKKFLRYILERVEKIPQSDELCTANEIAKLPEPLQRFCAYIGLEGFPKYQAINIYFPDTDFIFDDKSGKLLKMAYDLWLTYDIPYRTAYCGSSMYGIPFEGMDYMTDSKTGGMKGILGKVFPIFDVTDAQGYRAGLISWMAESCMNPSVLFSEYITFEEVDASHVKVTVSFDGVTGSGLFTIDETGSLTEFYSNERQVGEVNGEVTLIGWRCEYEDYQKKQGILIPTKVKVVKVFPDKELEYFSGEIAEVKFLKHQ